MSAEMRQAAHDAIDAGDEFIVLAHDDAREGIQIIGSTSGANAAHWLEALKNAMESVAETNPAALFEAAELSDRPRGRLMTKILPI